MSDDMDRAQEWAAHRAALELARAQEARRDAWAATHTGPADACVDCGEPIEAARRAAVPEAARCTFCQSEIEEGR